MTPKRALAEVLATAVTLFAKLLTAVRSEVRGFEGRNRQCVFFANHASHGDFILIAAALPPDMRRRTRPVAGADYWLKGPFRSFLGQFVFRAVLIPRQNSDSKKSAERSDPRQAITMMVEALDEGASLIVFPEGTRNTSDEVLLPFKSGLYRLAEARPDSEFVPVWITNLNRVLPKGEALPVPLLCSVVLGPALKLEAGEHRTDFLARSRAALLALSEAVPNSEHEDPNQEPKSNDA